MVVSSCVVRQLGKLRLSHELIRVTGAAVGEEKNEVEIAARDYPRRGDQVQAGFTS